jgi:hypothetical protein
MKPINSFILLSLTLVFSIEPAVAQDVYRMTVAQDGSGLKVEWVRGRPPDRNTINVS